MLGQSSPSFSTPLPAIPLPSPVQERFMRLPEVIRISGLSRATIYELMRKDAFPQNVSLGGRNVAWPESEISAWVKARMAARTQGGAQ